MGNIIEKHLVMMNNAILEINIDNKKPIELLDLTKALASLACQYNRYVDNNAEYATERESKLLIKEVRTGSVILQLVEFASASILPFAENVNTIVGFSTFLKVAFDYVLNKSDNNKLEDELKEIKLEVTDLKDMSK